MTEIKWCHVLWLVFLIVGYHGCSDDSEADSDTNNSTDTDVDTGTDADADTDADSDTDTDSDMDTDSDTDTDTDTGTEECVVTATWGTEWKGGEYVSNLSLSGLFDHDNSGQIDAGELVSTEFNIEDIYCAAPRNNSLVFIITKDS